jgi:hypothetical protein
MMTTSFYPPNNITQVGVHNDILNVDSIPWNDASLLTNQNHYASLSKPLYTMAGFWQEMFRSQTNELWCTDFRIPASSRPVAGIELQLHALRASRIEDLLIQLTLNGELIGLNGASTANPVQSDMYTGMSFTLQKPVEDYNIYGSSTELWGTTLSASDVSNSTFGVVISFQSNQVIPHRDLITLNQVALRITYA